MGTFVLSGSRAGIGSVVVGESQATKTTMLAGVGAAFDATQPVPTYTSWSTTDKLNVTLSGGNLTATVGSNLNGGVRAVDRQLSGKYYFECTVTIASTSTLQVGLASSSASLTVTTSGSAGQFFLNGSGTVCVDGSQLSSPNFAAITTGSLICVAVDCDNHRIWWRVGAGGNWNNNAGYNPATNNGGVAIPEVLALYPFTAMSTVSGGTQNVVANFGDSAFSGTVPSGFTAGFLTGTPTLNAVLTQMAIQQWADGNPSARLTQLAVEQWSTPTGTGVSALLTQIAVEHWGQIAVVTSNVSPQLCIIT